VKVCVVISVRNGEDYLARAIDSVLAQEGVELELRVYDNGSTDGSVEIARGYLADRRVSHTVNGDGFNYFNSVNRALVESDAELLVPFACDDLMRPGNLALKVGALTGTDAGFVHGPCRIVDEHDHVTGASASLDHVPSACEAGEFLRHLVPENGVMCQTVVARTDALRAIGGFDPRIWFCGDWDCWLRLALRFPVLTVREPLIDYRVHSASATSGGGFSAAQQMPPTLRRLLADPGLPAWAQAERHSLVARQLLASAHLLRRGGQLRGAGGTNAYALAWLALREQPGEALYAEDLLRGVTEAGLALPLLPLDLVVPVGDAEPAATARAADEAVRLARAGLAARLLFTVEPAHVDAAVAILEPALAGVEAQLVPIADPLDALEQGRAVLVPPDSPLVEAAEALGVPAFPYDQPDPFARTLDPARWDTVRPREVAFA
jgi:hypothetical protein